MRQSVTDLSKLSVVRALAEQPAGITPTPTTDLMALPTGWNNLATAALLQLGQRTTAQVMKDSLKNSKTGGELISSAVAVAGYLRRVTNLDDKFIGVLLPPSVPAATINLACTLLGKVPVNLDPKNVGDPVEICGIKNVVTTPAVLESQSVTLPAGVTAIDPAAVLSSMTESDVEWTAHVLIALKARSPEVAQYLPGVLASLDDIATILFTTGSTGKPKGVIITQRNILSQGLTIGQTYGLKLPEGAVADASLKPIKRILGKLPFSHALGLTGTVWTPILLDLEVVYHHNALEMRAIGKVCLDEQIHVIVTSPTLLQYYLKLNKPDVFASIVMILVGSEKCPVATSKLCFDKLGIYPNEAFGSTEMSPLATSNTRCQVKGKGGRLVAGNRVGTVGQPVAGTSVAVVNFDTNVVADGRVRYDYYLPLQDADLDAAVRKELEAERAAEIKANSGVLLFHGPQIMRGYLNRDEATEAVLYHGWYYTGDVGYVDEDGFVVITGRLSRFAKIAGEMVPLGNIELEIMSVTRLTAANVHVGAVPSSRGEKLVVMIFIDPQQAPCGVDAAKIVDDLQKKGVPTLFLPDARDFTFTDEPFKLAPGTGKIDLSDMKRRLLEVFGG